MSGMRRWWRKFVSLHRKFVYYISSTSSVCHICHNFVCSYVVVDSRLNVFEVFENLWPITPNTLSRQSLRKHHALFSGKGLILVMSQELQSSYSSVILTLPVQEKTIQFSWFLDLVSDCGIDRPVILILLIILTCFCSESNSLSYTTLAEHLSAQPHKYQLQASDCRQKAD